MAKAQGIIGNFKGKIGNTVGYQLTSSNNKQTQGIRIYQPNVKNPKTSAQAEQRAMLAPINATYRALKMVIDRGNEGLPYGNKSRLAWLKQAFKAQNMPWIGKGAVPYAPVICQLTKGSLQGLSYVVDDSAMVITVPGFDASTDISTIGKLTTALLAANLSLKEGDQLTFVAVQLHDEISGQPITANAKSIVLDSTSADAQSDLKAGDEIITYEMPFTTIAGAIIVSREGANGEHLRSNTSLVAFPDALETAPYNAASKTAAIESYMASGAANTDWAEESIQ